MPRRDEITKRCSTPQAEAVFKLLELDLQSKSPSEQRAYLGMSGIGGCLLQQYLDLTIGRRSSLSGDKYGIRGYLFERDIKERLQRIGYYVPNSEVHLIAPFDERFQGHTDGATPDGMLLEIKSINSTNCRKCGNKDGFWEIVETDQPNEKHLAQIQTYMRYGTWEHCLIVYVDVNTMNHWPLLVKKNPQLGEENERKARYILTCVDHKEVPKCSCGYCKNDPRILKGGKWNS